MTQDKPLYERLEEAAATLLEANKGVDTTWSQRKIQIVAGHLKEKQRKAAQVDALAAAIRRGYLRGTSGATFNTTFAELDDRNKKPYRSAAEEVLRGFITNKKSEVVDPFAS